MASLNVGGFWWLPGRQNKVPGFLTFDAQQGGTLNLVGALMEIEETAPHTPIEGGVKIDFTEEAFEAAGTYSRILGEAEGKAYTLEGCFETHRSGPMLFVGKAHHQIVHVNRIFVNVHFEEDEVASGDCISVQFDGLTPWVARSGVTGTRNVSPNKEDPKFSLTGRELPDDFIEISEFGKLVLQHHINLNVNVPTHVVEQRFIFGLESSRVVPVDDLIDIVSDLQDLVSIGTGRTASFDSLTLFHPDLCRQLPDGRESVNQPIEFLAQWSAKSGGNLNELRPHEMFFSMQDLGGMPSVAKWLAVARKHRDTLGRVLATRYEQKMYVSDRYLSRLAALEAFDRKEVGRRATLNQRLTRCAELAGEPIGNLIPDMTQWIEILVKDRNEIAHQLGRRQRQERIQWYFFAESAYWLYVLCILRLAEAPAAVFQKVTENQQYLFLGRRMARLLSESS